MRIKIYIITYNIGLILALMISTMIIIIVLQSKDIGYYNKIFKYNTGQVLSNKYIGLITATVTGDDKNLDKELKNLYKNLEIKHLLVLSGSNLTIFSLFIVFKYYRHNLSYLALFYTLIYSYVNFIGFLHPVSRAFIYMSFHDFIILKGLKSSKTVNLALVLLIFLVFLPVFSYSMSFILSFLFYLLIRLYSFLPIDNRVIRSIIFPFFMTFSSIPIYIFFFGEGNFYTILISNLFITPIYDYFTFIMYITYFIAFLHPINPFVYVVSQGVFEYFLRYIMFINSINQYIISL